VVVLVHQLMRMTDLVEREGVRETGGDFLVDDQLVDSGCLFVVG
jgi:hypothetical protein